MNAGFALLQSEPSRIRRGAENWLHPSLAPTPGPRLFRSGCRSRTRASFALIVYASAYPEGHYLAAFTCAMLNNQPMGFYSPAILTKDAQRNGLRGAPVDVLRSEWACTVTAERHPRWG